LVEKDQTLGPANGSMSVNPVSHTARRLGHKDRRKTKVPKGSRDSRSLHPQLHFQPMRYGFPHRFAKSLILLD
jgi:hypothetical protein